MISDLHGRSVSYIQVALAMMFVGASVPLAKIMLMDLPVMLACGARFATAVAFVLPLLWFRGESLRSVSRRDHVLLFVQAVPGVFLFPVLLFEGLKGSSGVAAGVITGMLPAVITVLATVLLSERPTYWVTLGMCLAAAGMVALGTGATNSSNADTYWGWGLILGAVISEAAYSVLARVIGTRLPAVVIAAWLSLFGLAAFAPFALWQASYTDVSEVSWRSWLIAAYLGICPSVLAFLLYFSAIRRIEAVTAGVFSGLVPLTAMVLSVAILGEMPGASEITGGILVLCAIALITAKKDAS